MCVWYSILPTDGTAYERGVHGNQNGELPHDCMVKTGMHKPYPGCVRGEESLINGEKSLDNFSLFRKDIAGVNV